MMTWIDASTDAYWKDGVGDYIYIYPIYIGGGHWTFPDNEHREFHEKETSPIRTENITVSGIRIYYSYIPDLNWASGDSPNFQFETNYARLSTPDEHGLGSGTIVQEWTFVPDIGERIVRISAPQEFTDFYSHTAIITKIELRTSIAPDAVWQNYRNTRERISE